MDRDRSTFFLIRPTPWHFCNIFSLDRLSEDG